MASKVSNRQAFPSLLGLEVLEERCMPARLWFDHFGEITGQPRPGELQSPHQEVNSLRSPNLLIDLDQTKKSPIQNAIDQAAFLKQSIPSITTQDSNILNTYGRIDGETRTTTILSLKVDREIVIADLDIFLKLENSIFESFALLLFDDQGRSCVIKNFDDSKITTNGSFELYFDMDHRNTSNEIPKTDYTTGFSPQIGVYRPAGDLSVFYGKQTKENAIWSLAISIKNSVQEIQPIVKTFKIGMLADDVMLPKLQDQELSQQAEPLFQFGEPISGMQIDQTTFVANSYINEIDDIDYYSFSIPDNSQNRKSTIKINLEFSPASDDNPVIDSNNMAFGDYYKIFIRIREENTVIELTDQSIYTLKKNCFYEIEVGISKKFTFTPNLLLPFETYFDSSFPKYSLSLNTILPDFAETLKPNERITTNVSSAGSIFKYIHESEMNYVCVKFLCDNSVAPNIAIFQGDEKNEDESLVLVGYDDARLRKTVDRSKGEVVFEAIKNFTYTIKFTAISVKGQLAISPMARPIVSDDIGANFAQALMLNPPEGSNSLHVNSIANAPFDVDIIRITNSNRFSIQLEKSRAFQTDIIYLEDGNDISENFLPTIPREQSAINSNKVFVKFTEFTDVPVSVDNGYFILIHHNFLVPTFTDNDENVSLSIALNDPAYLRVVLLLPLAGPELQSAFFPNDSLVAPLAPPPPEFPIAAMRTVPPAVVNEQEILQGAALDIIATGAIDQLADFARKGPPDSPTLWRAVAWLADAISEWNSPLATKIGPSATVPVIGTSPLASTGDHTTTAEERAVPPRMTEPPSLETKAALPPPRTWTDALLAVLVSTVMAACSWSPARQGNEKQETKQPWRLSGN